VDLAIAIIGAVAAVAAAAAAVGSWLAARRANATAASLAAIERDRRHDEMTPEFEITCTARGTPEAAPASAELYIVLTGGRLERHAAVSVTIQDEAGQDHWARGLPDGVTLEEAQAFVWGGWEFNTDASTEVVSNRESRPRPYDRVSGQNWDLFALVPTRPGSWMGSVAAEKWRKRWTFRPLRILVTCQCEGYDPWFIQREVKIHYPRTVPGMRVPGDPGWSEDPGWPGW
jgi:hypothetical protein